MRDDFFSKENWPFHTYAYLRTDFACRYDYFPKLNRFVLRNPSDVQRRFSRKITREI
jgi:hypothetical protein